METYFAEESVSGCQPSNRDTGKGDLFTEKDSQRHFNTRDQVHWKRLMRLREKIPEMLYQINMKRMCNIDCFRLDDVEKNTLSVLIRLNNKI